MSADSADSAGQPGVLFPSTWTIRYFGEQNPGVALLDLPAVVAMARTSAIPLRSTAIQSESAAGCLQKAPSV